MLALRHFNSYCGSLAHLSGDLVLKGTAAAWAHLLAGHGFLARYGGEEFAVFLPDKDPVVAVALFHRLQLSVTGGQTCSIGVAVRRDEEAAAQAMARADQALYDAKRAGRNRTTWHGSDGPSGADAADRQAPIGLAHSRLS